MCGRYTLFTPAAELERRFDASFTDSEARRDDGTIEGTDDDDAPFKSRYNCAPGQELPVITAEEPSAAARMEWGLTPSFAEEARGLINARAETVREKRSFADAFERRRCLVPADGFYEWVDGGGDGKTPYRVAFEDDRPFAMAGLYDRWEPPTPETTQTGLGAFGGGADDGGDDAANPDGRPEVLESFTVVTTEPNDLIADLHHRMAVVLDPEEETTWLHGDPEAAAALMDPYPADELTAFPVSTRVNSPANDGPELIEPVG